MPEVFDVSVLVVPPSNALVFSCIIFVLSLVSASAFAVSFGAIGMDWWISVFSGMGVSTDPEASVLTFSLLMGLEGTISDCSVFIEVMPPNDLKWLSPAPNSFSLWFLTFFGSISTSPVIAVTVWCRGEALDFISVEICTGAVEQTEPEGSSSKNSLSFELGWSTWQFISEALCWLSEERLTTSAELTESETTFGSSVSYISLSWSSSQIFSGERLGSQLLPLSTFETAHCASQVNVGTDWRVVTVTIADLSLTGVLFVPSDTCSTDCGLTVASGWGKGSEGVAETEKSPTEAPLVHLVSSSTDCGLTMGSWTSEDLEKFINSGTNTSSFSETEVSSTEVPMAPSVSSFEDCGLTVGSGTSKDSEGATVSSKTNTFSFTETELVSTEVSLLHSVFSSKDGGLTAGSGTSEDSEGATVGSKTNTFSCAEPKLLSTEVSLLHSVFSSKDGGLTAGSGTSKDSEGATVGSKTNTFSCTETELLSSEVSLLHSVFSSKDDRLTVRSGTRGDLEGVTVGSKTNTFSFTETELPSTEVPSLHSISSSTDRGLAMRSRTTEVPANTFLFSETEFSLRAASLVPSVSSSTDCGLVMGSGTSEVPASVESWASTFLIPDMTLSSSEASLVPSVSSSTDCSLTMGSGTGSNPQEGPVVSKTNTFPSTVTELVQCSNSWVAVAEQTAWGVSGDSQSKEVPTTVCSTEATCGTCSTSVHTESVIGSNRLCLGSVTGEVAVLPESIIGWVASSLMSAADNSVNSATSLHSVLFTTACLSMTSGLVICSIVLWSSLSWALTTWSHLFCAGTKPPLGWLYSGLLLLVMRSASPTDFSNLVSDLTTAFGSIIFCSPDWLAGGPGSSRGDTSVMEFFLLWSTDKSSLIRLRWFIWPFASKLVSFTVSPSADTLSGGLLKSVVLWSDIDRVQSVQWPTSTVLWQSSAMSFVSSSLTWSCWSVCSWSVFPSSLICEVSRAGGSETISISAILEPFSAPIFPL